MTSLIFYKTIFPQLFQGASITLAIAFFASLIGFFGGAALAIAQTIKSSWLKNLVTLWVTIVRGTPMLLQIIFLDLIILPQLGIRVSPFITAIIAIGLNSCAYISQIIRSGIASVSYGQVEAAYTLGISKMDIMRFIVLPQALRVVIPALGNEFVTLIKDSSLASLIGVMELYQRGTIIISQTHKAIPVYIAIGSIYLLMTTVISLIVNKTEDYMRYAQD